jgi:hypothetical protein
MQYFSGTNATISPEHPLFIRPVLTYIPLFAAKWVPKAYFDVCTRDSRQFGGHFFICKYKSLCNTNFTGMVIFILISGVRV